MTKLQDMQDRLMGTQNTCAYDGIKNLFKKCVSLRKEHLFDTMLCLVRNYGYDVFLQTKVNFKLNYSWHLAATTAWAADVVPGVNLVMPHQMTWFGELSDLYEPSPSKSQAVVPGQMGNALTD